VKKFTVVLHGDVESVLANLALEYWGTPQLEPLSQASAQIDRVLAERPTEVGTSAGANLRYLTVPAQRSLCGV
jgi:hypothetical protein